MTPRRRRTIRGYEPRHRRERPRRRRGPLSAVVALVLVVGATAAGLLVTPRHATGSSPTPFYVDVGASASLGVQPTGNPAHNGAFTKEGYGDEVVRIEAAKGTKLVLHKIGCMGETAQSMAGAGDHCYKLPATQLTTAEAFLRSHRNDPGVVSIDLGFNNVRPCLWVVPLATACVNTGIAEVKKDLPGILHQLTSAAGPQVHLVGLTYADPFLFRYLKVSPGPARATESLADMERLDGVLTAAYRAAGVAVANVAAAFDSTDTKPTTLTHYGQVPTNVARICQLTWMCAAYPFGPDDHPNKTGYYVIAQTIIAALPSSI
ncbi:MAG: hypothetical protein ACRDV0_02870 [Acidimicrobiales bacterium]